MARASTDLGGRGALANRYRAAAMAEFWRALKTLKARQAEQALATDAAVAMPSTRPAAPSPARRPRPNEPERGALPRPEYVLPDQPASGRVLHEPAASWQPNEPEPMRADPGGCREGPRTDARTNPAVRNWGVR